MLGKKCLVIIQYLKYNSINENSVSKKVLATFQLLCTCMRFGCSLCKTKKGAL